LSGWSEDGATGLDAVPTSSMISLWLPISV
jgi:hypothetical protein